MSARTLVLAIWQVYNMLFMKVIHTVPVYYLHLMVFFPNEPVPSQFSSCTFSGKEPLGISAFISWMPFLSPKSTSSEHERELKALSILADCQTCNLKVIVCHRQYPNSASYNKPQRIRACSMTFCTRP